MSFKDEYTFEERQCESNKIMKKYPSRIPVIVEKSKDCQLRIIDKKKYLVPKDLNMNQFIYIIRKKIELEKSQALFFMINNQLCPSNISIGELYEKNKDQDGFLYIIYTSENTFG